MNTGRVLFRTENWTVSEPVGDFIHVGHINCPRSEFVPMNLGPEHVEYTWVWSDKCFFCHEKFPEFISNMRTFVKWCGGP